MNEQMRENLMRGSEAYPFVLYHMPHGDNQVAAMLHWQEDAEILSVTSGELDLFVDGNLSVLHAGDIVCINPGQLHSFHGSTPDTQLDIFIFPWKSLQFACPDHDQHKYLSFLADGKLGFPMFFCQSEEIFRMTVYAIELQKQRPAAYEMMTKAVLLMITARLAQAEAFIPLRPEKQEETCKKILAYIQQHYMEKLTVKDISAAIGISPTYFSSFFSGHFHQCFAEYLRSFRIEQACVLLISTNLSIAEIAVSVGFGSSSHFIQQFGESKGITPLRYRGCFGNV